MANYWSIVNKVIDDSDVILLVLDSRFINETRNWEIEKKVRGNKKVLIYVMTKCDLVDKSEIEKSNHNLKPSVFVSAKEHLGTTMLRDRILIEAQKAGLDKLLKVGVLGYPNVGKSSLINAMKGRQVAPTSVVSGFTKGVQKIRGDNRMMFLDTPGVIPFQEKDVMKHTFIGSIDFAKSREPDLVAMELMEKFPGKIEEFYGVKVRRDKEKTLEELALKKNILKKGAIPDIMRMGSVILKDWQKGVIRVKD
jgi:ribosome biogenesis GTPase A